MVVQYDSDTNEWSTWLDKFKTQIPEPSKEASTFFEKTKDWDFGLAKASLNGDADATDKWITKLKLSDNSLKEFLKSWDGVGNIAEAYQCYLKESANSTTLFQKATSVAASAIKTIGATLLSMGISFVVGEVLHGVSELVTYSDTLADKASELGGSFKSSETEIENYNQKIQELRDKISDSATPYDEVIQARKDLMGIQDELIEKYGKEEGAINAITDAINGQSNSLNSLTDIQYTKLKNNYNKTGFWGSVQNLFAGNKSNFDQAVQNMESYSSSIKVSGNEKLNQYIRSLGGQEKFDNNGMSTGYFELNGTLEEVYDKLLSIQSLASKMGETDYSQGLANQASKADELLEKYKDIYNAYILNEKIPENDTYSKSLEDALSIYEKYRDSVEKFGQDSEEAQKNADEYCKVVSEAIQTAFENGDTGVVEYFRSLFPELQAEVSSWEFKVKITPTLSNGSDNPNYDSELETKFKNAISQFDNAEDILNFNPQANPDKQDAYNQLSQIAQTNFQNNINAMVDFAVQSYGLQTQGEQDFLNRIKNNQQNSVDDATASSWYRSLSSDEDKALVNSQAFVNALKEQKDSLEDGKYSAENYASALDKIKQSQSGVENATKSEMISEINGLSEGFEELDKIMTSIKKKDNVFDYSLLDDEKFKNNFGAFKEEYTDLINTIGENPKNITACQQAFDNLATAFIYDSNVMKMLNEDNASVAQQYLELMGVQNADEIVTAGLAERHAELAWESQDLTNATADEIQALAEESEQTDIGREAFKQYIAQKLLDSPISTLADIEQLNAIMTELGLATNAWREYYSAKRDSIALANAPVKTDASGYTYKEIESDRNGQKVTRVVSSLAEKANSKKTTDSKKNLAAELENKAKVAPVKGYTGPKSTNPSKSSGGGGKKDSTPKENSTIDWISRTAELLERKSEELKTAIDDTWTAYTGLSEEDIKRVQELFSLPIEPDSAEAQELLNYANTLGVSLDKLKELSENNGLENRQSLLQQLIGVDQDRLDQAQSALDYYKNSYEELVAKVPGYREKIENGGVDIESMTGDQKTNVENATKAYDSYLDNQKKVKELQKTLRDEKGDYYDNIIDKVSKENEKLSSSNDLIEKQIDLLKTKGNIVDASMYEEMIGNTKAQINNTAKILSTRKKKLTDAMADGLEEGDEEWYDMTQSILEAEESLTSLKKDQAELNKELKEMPITNMTTIINMYKDISTAIQNWGAEIEASGTALSADYYQELIKNGSTIIDEYKKQSSIIQDIMDTYDVGSDNWNELYSQLQSVNSEISSMVQNLKKWNEEMLQLPLTKINDYSSNLSSVKDALTNLQDDYTTVISAVTSAIEDETKSIQDQQKEYQKSIEKQKDAIQDKIDLLDKQNTKLQLQQDLEQKLYNLQVANTQKTEKVIRNGEIVYETNTDNIRNAQKELQDAQYNITKQELQDQLDALNDQLDAYNDKVDEQLDALDKIKEKWSEIAENVTKAQNAAVATDYLGAGWKDKVLSGNDADIYNAFKSQYEQNAAQIQMYEKQIDATEKLYSLMNEYVTAYKAGTISYDATKAAIENLTSQLNKNLDANTNLTNTLKYTQLATGASGSSVEQVLAGIQSDLATSGANLITSLEQYQQNSKLISEQTSSWQQLTNNVAEMLSVLKDVRKNLKNAERDDDDEDDDDSSSSKKHSSKSDGPGKSAWSNKDENNGPGAEINRKKAGIAHSGLGAGVVGKNGETSSEAWMKVHGLKDLDPDEYPYILKLGEQVINEEQRKTLMSNFQNAYSSAYTEGIKRGITAASASANQVNNNSYTINAPIDNIVLQNVQNSKDLAEDLMNNFRMTMAQQFSKFYK